jgi:hypothetical protein
VRNGAQRQTDGEYPIAACRGFLRRNSAGTRNGPARL